MFFHTFLNVVHALEKTSYDFDKKIQFFGGFVRHDEQCPEHEIIFIHTSDQGL